MKMKMFFIKLLLRRSSFVPSIHNGSGKKIKFYRKINISVLEAFKSFPTNGED
jgi:hypothetical protein